MTKFVKWFSVSVVLVMLTACGGGGGNPQKDPVAEASTNDDVVLVEDNNSKEIVEKEGNATHRALLLTGKMAKELEVGKILHIPAGIDSRFPLGFSGKVAQKSTEGNRTKISFAEVGLSEILDELKQPKATVPLNEANIIGVVAPSAVGSHASKRAKVLGKDAKSFLGGALVYVPSKREKISTDGSIRSSGDKILLNMEIDFSKFVSDATKLKPLGGKSEGKIIVEGTIEDMKFEGSYDAGFKGSSPYLAMHSKLIAKLDAEVKFKGTATLDVGSYDRAWREVKDHVFDLTFTDIEVKGLKSRDKVGKYPIAGIVYQSPTPVVYRGKTQTPLRQAKMGGFILWLYIDAKGSLSIEGEVGAATHLDFEMGIDKEKGSDFTINKKINPIANKRLLEAPFIDGKVVLQSQVGLSADLDTFIAGVRVANLGIDAKGIWTQTYETDKRISYGIDKLGDPWSWEGGRICQEGRLEGGVRMDGAVSFSIDDTKVIDNKSFSYPTQRDIDAVEYGWVKHMWYINKLQRKCFNNKPPKTVFGIVNQADGFHITLSTTDEEHDPVTYTITRNPAHGTLSGTAPNLVYIPDEGYTGSDDFVLVTYDGYDTSTITIPIVQQIQNIPPVANAGADFSVNGGATVVLDGSDSTDSDGSIVSYVWKEGTVVVGTTDTVALDSVSDGAHTYTLAVTDDDNATASDSVVVHVGSTATSTKVKKTGQTKSYDVNGNEVTDGSIKDDGFYQKGVTPSYSRANEVVTDHITGLQWQDDTAAKTVTKPWATQANYDAGNYSDTSGDTATTYCATLTLDGGGWRLPTVQELQGIVVDGAYSPSIDTTAFVNYSTSSSYWSATTHAYYTNDAWVVYFGSGNTNSSYKSDNYNVRCVK